MAQTISELEKERAELLKQIEAQANQLSSERGEQQEHTLQDWLKAAQQVVPDEPEGTQPRINPRATSTASQSKVTPAPQARPKIEPDLEPDPAQFAFLSQLPEDKTSLSSQVTDAQKIDAQTGPKIESANEGTFVKSNKTTFFSLIIVFTLSLTLLGLMYIAYMSLSKDLQLLAQDKQASQEEIFAIKDALNELQQTLDKGGDSKAFDALSLQVIALEEEMALLKEQLQQSKPSPAQALTDLFDPDQAKDGKWVTTDVLDQKLQAYTQSIDRKLQLILTRLGDQTPQALAPSAPPQEDPMPMIAEPMPPVVPQPQVGKLNQPVVRLTEQRPAQVAAQAIPKAPQTADVSWLLAQPSLHYTLQLASMDNEAGVKQIVRQKGIASARVLPQTRNGQTRYVLLVGSFESRKQASELAARVKQDHGISPWIRKVKDISRLVN